MIYFELSRIANPTVIGLLRVIFVLADCTMTKSSFTISLRRKQTFCNRLHHFGWICNQPHIYPISDLFAGFTKSCFSLKFCQIRFELASCRFALLITEIDPRLEPCCLCERKYSVKFSDNQTVSFVQLYISVMSNVFRFVKQVRHELFTRLPRSFWI